MKFIKIITAITLIIICSCTGKDENNEYLIREIEKEIQKLDKPSKRINYLEGILKDDQKVRNSEKSAELVVEFGIESSEYMEYTKEQWKQHKINLIKIEKYLEIHGFPDKQMGENATLAPWMVIHHSQGYETRERNFSIIYEAYLKGNIDESEISFFLGRMYEIRNGKRLKMENPYKLLDEIDQLIKELNLENKKIEVLKRVKKNTQDNTSYKQ